MMLLLIYYAKFMSNLDLLSEIFLSLKTTSLPLFKDFHRDMLHNEAQETQGPQNLNTSLHLDCSDRALQHRVIT